MEFWPAIRGMVEEVWPEVWQEGLEELVQWNSGLRGVVEEVWQEVWQEGLEELLRWNSGLRR